MQILKILAFIILAAGFIMVYAAGWAVNKFGLDKNAKCDFVDEMNEDELKQYKHNRAVLNFKMLGMLVALPGLVLLLIVFR